MESIINVNNIMEIDYHVPTYGTARIVPIMDGMTLPKQTYMQISSGRPGRGGEMGMKLATYSINPQNMFG